MDNIVEDPSREKARYEFWFQLKTSMLSELLCIFHAVNFHLWFGGVFRIATVLEKSKKLSSR